MCTLQSKRILHVLFLVLVLQLITITVHSQNTPYDLSLLINELNQQKGKQEFDHYDIRIQTENTQWSRGLLLGFYNDLPTELHETYEFLAKRDEGGNFTNVAIIYSEKFKRWLDEVPEDILSEKAKPFYGDSGSKISSLRSTSTWPDFAFPWTSNVANYKKKWRFNSGPHSYDGPNHPEKTWSGIDFGIPLDSTSNENHEVRAVEVGIVSEVVDNCSLRIVHLGNWGTRTLHIDNIKVKVGDEVQIGTLIGYIDETPCANADAPHLHLDLIKNGNYFPIDGLPIGGWVVHSSGGHYNGYLERDGFSIPADVVNKQQAQIVNLGYVGLASNSAPQQKFNDSVVICSEGICQVVPENVQIESLKIPKLQKFLNWIGYSLQFWKKSSTGTASLTSTDSFACIDFDTDELQKYNFPGTTLNLLQNATEAKVVFGGCNSIDRPMRADNTTTGLTGAKLIKPHLCIDDTTKRLHSISNDTNCYQFKHEVSHWVTLPFNPTKVTLTDANYFAHLYERNGKCSLIGDNVHTEFAIQGDFVRIKINNYSNPTGCVPDMYNDQPVVYTNAEGYTNLFPPMVLWNMTDQNPDAKIWVELSLIKYTEAGGYTQKKLILPAGVSQWKPDEFEPGSYIIGVTVKGGSYDSAPYSNPGGTLYEIVAGPSWYPGWNETNTEYAGETARTMHFSVPAGRVLDIYGSNVIVNGSPLTSLAKSSSTASGGLTQTVYRFGMGEYEVEWTNGMVYEGQDFGTGYHLWQAEKNAAIYGGTWNTIDLRNPNEIPTTTSTPTPVATSTLVPTAVATPITTVSPTPTPPVIVSGNQIFLPIISN